MNRNEFKDLDHDWDAEKTRRLRYLRNNAIKDAIRSARIELAILVALVVGFIVFMYYWNKYQPLRDRAAYEEGVRRADQQAAAVGGWDNWIAKEVAKCEVK